MRKSNFRDLWSDFQAKRNLDYLGKLQSSLIISRVLEVQKFRHQQSPGSSKSLKHMRKDHLGLFKNFKVKCMLKFLAGWGLDRLRLGPRVQISCDPNLSSILIVTSFIPFFFFFTFLSITTLSFICLVFLFVFVSYYVYHSPSFWVSYNVSGLYK